MKLGTIQTELRVAKGGYTPGEAIRVSLNIKNGSRRSVRNVAICLCQIVNYRYFLKFICSPTSLNFFGKYYLSKKER